MSARAKTPAGDKPTRMPDEQPAPKASAAALAQVTLHAVPLAAKSIATWGSSLLNGDDGPNVDLVTLFHGVKTLTERVQDGQLDDAEAVLTTQAAVLNVVFANLLECAHQAAMLDQRERYLRLAFKGQSQCRATYETLALLKNPPVFTRQANISHGPQQVNNGPLVNAALTRAGIHNSEPNKLLEDGAHHGEQLDTRAACKTRACDSAVAPVGTINRAAHVRGESTRVEKRVSRRTRRID